jgi:molybdopterin molybdotransferase
MISVEQALKKILGHVDVLGEEERPVLDCAGQVLAEDVSSDIDVPPLDNTAMDGYAVRSEDTRGAEQASPRFLKVIDTVPAGSISRQKVTAGTAIRIMTGAPIPAGADSVVPFENTDETQRQGPSAEIGILYQSETGGNIRRAGEDIARGSLVLNRGTVVRPQEVGVLASLGRSTARVIRRPLIALLATGDELVDIDQPLPPGKIYNSNAYSIAALVRRYGGIAKLLGIALDNEEALVAKLSQGLSADMLITSGGVSAGDYDIVKDVLARYGEITFWTVRMKPGKPLAFGRIRRGGQSDAAGYIPHLGLPGNPVSTMVTFELFARPAILKMMGKRNLAKPTVEAVLEDTVVNKDGRRIYTRAMVSKCGDRYFARTTGPQGSGILTSMTSANGLAIIPEDRARVTAGEVVPVMMLDWSEE